MINTKNIYKLKDEKQWTNWVLFQRWFLVLSSGIMKWPECCQYTPENDADIPDFRNAGAFFLHTVVVSWTFHVAFLDPAEMSSTSALASRWWKVRGSLESVTRGLSRLGHGLSYDDRT